MRYIFLFLLFGCVDDVNEDIQNRFDEAERKIDERLDEIEERINNKLDELNDGDKLDSILDCRQRRWSVNGVETIERNCTVIYKSG